MQATQNSALPQCSRPWKICACRIHLCQRRPADVSALTRLLLWTWRPSSGTLRAWTRTCWCSLPRKVASLPPGCPQMTPRSMAFCSRYCMWVACIEGGLGGAKAGLLFRPHTGLQHRSVDACTIPQGSHRCAELWSKSLRRSSSWHCACLCCKEICFNFAHSGAGVWHGWEGVGASPSKLAERYSV